MKQENKTRRIKRMTAGNHVATVSLLLCGMIFIQTTPFAQTNSVSHNSNKTTANKIVILQETDFTATPHQLYQTLLNSKKFSACTKNSFKEFSEASAVIDSSVGGTFSLFDGHIMGRILELVPDRRIVEAWRVVDWPAGVYSIAKFEFKPQGAGTHLEFSHIGFPEGLKEHLADGWQQHYWDALKKYLPLHP